MISARDCERTVYWQAIATGIHAFSPHTQIADPAARANYADLHCDLSPTFLAPLKLDHLDPLLLG